MRRIPCARHTGASAVVQPLLFRPVLLGAIFAAMTPALIAQSPGSLASPGPLGSGGAHYSIEQDGKGLGDAQYSVATIPGGYTITSSGHMSLGKFSYGFRNTDTLDASLNLVRDALTGSVKGVKASGNNISFDTASDATGRNLQISISAEGKQTSNSVDRHRNTVLMPDLDPGAYMLMVRLAMEQPQTAWILIPKESGLLVPATYELQADVRGSLNGANINVRHATAELSDRNSITVELYYSEDGSLLEADLNAQNLDVVRDGFKLTEHPAPTPPPPGQAAPPPGPQQAPQSQ